MCMEFKVKCSECCEVRESTPRKEGKSEDDCGLLGLAASLSCTLVCSPVPHGIALHLQE